MWLAIGTISILAMIVLFIIGLIMSIKKKKARLYFLGSLACFALLLITIFAVSTSPDIKLTPDEFSTAKATAPVSPTPTATSISTATPEPSKEPTTETPA